MIGRCRSQPGRCYDRNRARPIHECGEASCRQILQMLKGPTTHRRLPKANIRGRQRSTCLLLRTSISLLWMSTGYTKCSSVQRTEQASDTPEQSRIIVIEAPPKPTEIRWSDRGAPRLHRRCRGFDPLTAHHSVRHEPRLALARVGLLGVRLTRPHRSRKRAPRDRMLTRGQCWPGRSVCFDCGRSSAG